MPFFSTSRPTVSSLPACRCRPSATAWTLAMSAPIGSTKVDVGVLARDMQDNPMSCVSVSFSLDPAAVNPLTPRRRPFHTIQPALAVLNDGRVMPYGTMGGEGQPQTQAAVFTRYARFGQGLQQAVTAPRWLLGRTWGDVSTTLKLESRFEPALVEQLREAGHAVEVLPEAFSDTMGHAGALVRHPNGVIGGAADPRSDLAVLKLEYAQLGLQPADLQPLKFRAETTPLKKGSFVVSLGNPYPIARDGSASASWGIIANLTRKDGPSLDQGNPKPALHQSQRAGRGS